MEHPAGSPRSVLDRLPFPHRPGGEDRGWGWEVLGIRELADPLATDPEHGGNLHYADEVVGHAVTR